MQKTLRVYQINAFTDRIFAGNPAGVVANADGLSDKQMQSIARELNNSETAFLFKPEDESHDLRVRFFTPICEVPTCGHASISSAFVWSQEQSTKKTVFHQKIQIGILPLEVVHEDQTLYFMTQGKVDFDPLLEPALADQVTAALGLTSSDLLENLPIQGVSTGHEKIIVPLKSREKLNSLTPNFGQLTYLSDQVGQNGFFPFAFDDGDSEVLTHARMFAPKIGINEDPVTGNGNGPLGAYLVHHQAVPHNSDNLKFISRQGEAIQRMGHAHVSVRIQNGEPEQVKVGGECILAFEGEMVIGIDS